MFGHQSDCSSLGDPVIHSDRCKEVGLRQWMLDLPKPFLSSSGSLDVVTGPAGLLLSGLFQAMWLLPADCHSCVCQAGRTLGFEVSIPFPRTNLTLSKWVSQVCPASW